MFLPVVAPDMRERLLELPALFWNEFKGKNSNDFKPGDWSRASYGLVWVGLRVNKSGQRCDTLMPREEEPVEPQTRDMSRFPRPWELPMKQELDGALREWDGPSKDAAAW